MVRVKICGLTSAEDALAAVEAGADAIGLNFHPGSPRFVGDALDEILAVIPPFITVVGVFVGEQPGAIERLRPSLDLLQLHGYEDPRDSAWLSAPILRAIRVRSLRDLDEIPAWSYARGLLLDGAGRPGTHGGARFDWSLVDAARKLTKLPIVLAGGLNPGNVADAVRQVRPFAVDVASGVESAPGRKSAELMKAFVAEAKGA